jgi:O-antigen/teichoic acid export membrane protein
MIALGRFRHRALVTAGRWLMRLALIVLLVEIGLGLEGAILGCIGASLTELALARWYIRPPLTRPGGVGMAQIWRYAAPLAIAGVSFRLLDGMDLLAWKAMGASEAAAGVYAAALSLALIPGIVSLSCSVLLLSSLSQLLRDHRKDEARQLGRDAWRAVLLLLPFAFLLAAAGTELSVFLLGEAFTASGPLLGLLIFAGIGRLLISMGVSILAAYGRPSLASILTGPLVPLSIAGYVIAIPLLAGTGAAIAAVTTCLFGGLVLSAAVYQQSGIRPDGLTILRSSIVCAAVYVLAVYWPAPGPLVLLKLTALGLLVPLLFVGVGELSIRQMLSFVQSHRRPAAQPSEAQDAA